MSRTKPIQDLIDKGEEAIRDEQWFEAERLLDRALSMSHSRRDFSGMIEITELLKTARKERARMALAVRKTVRILNESVTDTMDLDPGRYIIEPPLVGADARRLRLLALSREVPIAVLCREPLTQLGQTPIVAIGPNGAVRLRIDSPPQPNKPSAAWYRSALAALGEEAINSLNTDHAADRRVEAILGYLDTLPEDEAIHDLLCETCREAASGE